MVLADGIDWFASLLRATACRQGLLNREGFSLLQQIGRSSTETFQELSCVFNIIK